MMQHVNKKLLLSGLIMLTGFVFVLISLLLGASWLHAFDFAVGDAVHALRCEPLIVFSKACAFLFSLPMSIVYIVLIAVFLIVAKRWRALQIFAATMGSGQVISFVTKYLVARPRPVDAIAALPSSPAFPSGHTCTAFLLFLFLWLLLACPGLSQRDQDTHAQGISHRATIVILVVAILMACIVGLTRIYLGVHWPSDVLAGALLGAGVFCTGLAPFCGVGI